VVLTDVRWCGAAGSGRRVHHGAPAGRGAGWTWSGGGPASEAEAEGRHPLSTRRWSPRACGRPSGAIRTPDGGG